MQSSDSSRMQFNGIAFSYGGQEKLAKKQQGEEEAKQKAQQEKDLREAEVLAQKMYKTLGCRNATMCTTAGGKGGKSAV